MAVLAPIPSASERMAMEAKSGLRRIARSENRRSGNRLIILYKRRCTALVRRERPLAVQASCFGSFSRQCLLRLLLCFARQPLLGFLHELSTLFGWLVR